SSRPARRCRCCVPGAPCRLRLCSSADLTRPEPGRWQDRCMGSDISHVRAILLDGFGRVEEGVTAVLDGLSVDDLRWQTAPGANPIGWLLWHLSRQQDAQLAEILGVEEAWTAEGWRERFALPYEPEDSGYGQRPEQVAAFSVGDPALLSGYAGAVHGLTRRLVDQLDADALD